MKLLLLLPLLVAGQIYAQKVEIEFDESATFPLQNFAIQEGQLTPRPALNSELTRKKIDNEIRKRLMEKGLMEVSAKPDLNVRFTLGSARDRKWRLSGGLAGLGRAVSECLHRRTLVINLRDTSKGS
jgi:hypothetical protein